MPAGVRLSTFTALPRLASLARAGRPLLRSPLALLGACRGRAAPSVSRAERGLAGGRSQWPGHLPPPHRGRYRHSELRRGRRCMARSAGNRPAALPGLSRTQTPCHTRAGIRDVPRGRLRRLPPAGGAWSRLLLPLGTERREHERRSERGSCSSPIPGAAAAAAAASATAGEVT